MSSGRSPHRSALTSMPNSIAHMGAAADGAHGHHHSGGGGPSRFSGGSDEMDSTPPILGDNNYTAGRGPQRGIQQHQQNYNTNNSYITPASSVTQSRLLLKSADRSGKRVYAGYSPNDDDDTASDSSSVRASLVGEPASLVDLGGPRKSNITFGAGSYGVHHHHVDRGSVAAASPTALAYSPRESVLTRNASPNKSNNTNNGVGQQQLPPLSTRPSMLMGTSSFANPRQSSTLAGGAASAGYAGSSSQCSGSVNASHGGGGAFNSATLTSLSTLSAAGPQGGGEGVILGISIIDGEVPRTPWDEPLGWVATATTVFLLIVTAFALSASVAFTEITEMVVKNYVAIISDDSHMFDLWRDPSSEGVETYRKFTIFNVTNAADVVSGAAVPALSMLGPYCYKEQNIKYDVRFTRTHEHVKYKSKTVLTFDANCSVWTDSSSSSRRRAGRSVGGNIGNHSSGGDDDDGDDDSVYGPAVAPPRDDVARPQYAEDDEVVVASLGIISFFYRMGYLPDTLPNLTKAEVCSLLGAALSATPVGPNAMFMRVKVKDLLFGYEDAILATAKQILAGRQYYMGSSVTMVQGGGGGGGVVPSPYTFRSGQQCPLHENATAFDSVGSCNSTTNLDTREATGIINTNSMGTVTQWAGQKQMWWWGPRFEGYDEGDAVISKEPVGGVMPIGAGAFPSPYGAVIPIVEAECPLDIGYFAGQHDGAVMSALMSSGTNGLKFPPLGAVRKDTLLPFFADFIWRSTKLQYLMDSNSSGLDTLRFHLSDAFAANTTADQRCFQQFYQGVLNFTQPLFAPIFGVKGFFYGVDPLMNYSDSRYAGKDEAMFNFTLRFPSGGWNADTTTGGSGSSGATSAPVFTRMRLADYLGTVLDPSQAQADFDPFIDVDPYTGFTTRTSIQGTIMAEVGPLSMDGSGDDDAGSGGAACSASSFPQAHSMPRTMLPFVLIRRVSKLPLDVIDDIKDTKHDLKQTKAGLYATVVLGFAGLAIVVGIVVFARWRKAKVLAMDEEIASPLLKAAAGEE